MRSICWLAGICAAAGLLGVAGTVSGIWPVPWQVPGLATLIVLVPAVVWMAVLVYAGKRPPGEMVILVLAGPLFRIGCSLAGGVTCYYFSESVKSNALAFTGFGLVLYLVCLALETALVMKRNASSPASAIPGSGR